MHSILKITAALLLTVLPAGMAMGQSFSQRNDGSSNQDSSGYGRRRDRNNGSQDSSGNGNRRDQGNSDSGNNGGAFRNRDSSNDSGFSKPSFGSRDSGSSDSAAKSVTPTAQPMVAPKSTGSFIAKPLPTDLAILTTRSIFSRDHRAVAVASDTPRNPVFTSPVAKLIFRGAMLKRPDNRFVAFIEDSAGSRPPQWVGIGQTLTSNGGQIIDITLDNIVVEKDGSARQIPVGDNLDAGTRLANLPVTASVTPVSSSATPGSNSGSTVNIAAGNNRPAGANSSATPAATASTTGTASDDDVAEMMRRRRVQELGQ